MFAECVAEYSSSGVEEQGLDVGEGADVVESIEAAIFIFFVNQSILFLTKKMYERKSPSILAFLLSARPKKRGAVSRIYFPVFCCKARNEPMQRTAKTGQNCISRLKTIPFAHGILKRPRRYVTMK